MIGVFLFTVGFINGYKADVEILPSSPNSGIIFKRIDVKKNNIVIPSVFNVIDATLCTTVSNEFGVKVSTIEHLMAAMYGIGIDNALIEMDWYQISQEEEEVNHQNLWRYSL